MNDQIVKNAINHFNERLGFKSEQFNEALHDFLWTSLKELREQDDYVYSELENFATRTQMELLESRIDREALNPGEVFEAYGNAAIRSFEKAIELNQINESTEYTPELIQTLFEDTINFLSEDVLLEGYLKDLWNKYVEWFKESISVFVRGTPTLAAVTGLYMALGHGFPIFILVLLIVIIGGAATATVAQLGYGVNISKSQLELFKHIIHFFGILGKFIKDRDEEWGYRWDILFKNEEKCYQRAGLKKDDLGPRMFFSLKENSTYLRGLLLYMSEEKKMDQLRNCFLESFLDRIGIFFDLYFDCMYKSGKWNEIRDLSDDKLVQMFHMKGALYPMCDEKFITYLY